VVLIGLVWLSIESSEGALLNAVINIQVPLNAENYRVALQLVASRLVLSSIEIVSQLDCCNNHVRWNIHGL
jgi:hypothetical protein